MHIYINTYIDRGLLSSPPFAAQCYSLPSASLPMHWSIVNIPQKYLIPSESAKIAYTHIWAHVYICKLCLFVYSYSFCLLAAAYCHALYYGFFFFFVWTSAAFCLSVARKMLQWVCQCMSDSAHRRTDRQSSEAQQHTGSQASNQPLSHRFVLHMP